MTATVLVLGANGQVGRALARAAWPDGLSPHLLDRAACDITDSAMVDSVIQAAAPSIVINAAAYTAVDRAESEPEAAWRANAEGPGTIARACRRVGAMLVHISTDYVFDGRKAGRYIEDDPVAPLGIYGRSKEAGERAVWEATPRHAILRTQWVYSPDGKNFCKTMLRLGRERDDLGVVNDQHGAPTLAQDIAEALVAMVARMNQADGPFGTWHFANAGETTWYGFARAIFDGVEARIGRPGPRVRPLTTEQYPTPAARPKNSLFDCTRIAHDFGIAPRAWDEALSDCLEELLSQDARS